MNTLVLSVLSLWVTNFYSLQFNDVDGQLVSMGSYQNKKVLLVNIASGSPKAGQLAGLQQLKQQFGDSLEIIAFPSNSFGNETKSDAEIKSFCQNNYGITFKIAAKAPVAGAGLQPVYSWLSQQSQNGSMDLQIGKDFQKILIGRDGTIEGVFSPAIDPMDNSIVNAITSNN